VTGIAPGTIVTATMLDGLPAPVRRYLDWCGVEGRHVPATVAVRQIGRLRSANDKPWMAFTAEENFVTGPPAFSWRARVRQSGVPLVRAWDSYVGGRGRMRIRLAGLLTIADLSGAEMNQACLLRYLNEMAWFPAAFLVGNVSWEEIDDRSARVTITDSGLTAGGVLTFGRDGRPLEFAAPRHRHLGKGHFALEPWATPFTDYGVLNGVRVPTAGWAEYRTSTETVKYIEAELVGPASC
jgi:hypothetical protein